MNPKISVITTVLNCDNYISKSIESIAGQTFRDFEYIIINDGSSDNTSKIIHTFSQKDSRLIIIDNEKNLGRVKSLNLALGMASGKYIAIQDADDISLPERLKTQYLFLEKNHDHVLVGADVTVIDEKGSEMSSPLRPEKNLEAKFSLLFRCTFANPSIMFRKAVLDKHNIQYEEDFEHSEDFRIISLISVHGKVHNLTDRLVKYRKHESNNSRVNSNVLNETSTQIVKDNLAAMGFKVNFDQAGRLRKLISSRGINKKFLYEDVKLLFKIIKEFQKKNSSKGNREVLNSLRRMSGWLGKKNIVSRPEYLRLYISILTYYYKDSIFDRKKSETFKS
ncbi:MAG: glycosyltransferase [Ignavibacteria bacterium]